MNRALGEHSHNPSVDQLDLSALAIGMSMIEFALFDKQSILRNRDWQCLRHFRPIGNDVSRHDRFAGVLFDGAIPRTL
jgi:hypothetical protein